MKQTKRALSQKGIALVTLLIFVLIATTITSAATVLMIVNAKGAQKIQQGSTALNIAESGVENALMRLLRNSNYTGETILIDNGSATITVTGSTTKTILSIGTDGNFVRKVQVVADFNNNVLTLVSWKEIY